MTPGGATATLGRVRSSILLVAFVLGCGSSPSAVPGVAAGSAVSVTLTPDGDAVASHPASYDGQSRPQVRVHIEGATVGETARELAVLRGPVEASLERDDLRLTDWMMSQGMLQGVVRHRVAVTPAEVVVTYTLTPGPVYRVTTINAVEMSEARATPMGWVTPLKEGDVFNRDALAGAISKVNLAYHDLGYAAVETTPVSHVDPDTHTVSLVIEVTRHEVFTVEKVTVAGHTRVTADSIRARIDLKPGDRYNETALVRSKDALKATGSFDRIDISVNDGSEKGKLIISVEVSERAGAR